MFIQRNESFVCINCSKQVLPHPTSSRDHCNFCLYGLHVDISPGDRANSCKGVLEPINLRKKNHKDQIVFRCKKCGELKYCITAPDDRFEELLALGYN